MHERMTGNGQQPDRMVLRGARPYGGTAADVRIDGGKIAQIAPVGTLGADEERVLDADSLVMLPGFVDLHTHLREPGGEASETVETGTRSGLAGGFIDLFAMANTDPVTDSVGRLETLRRIADEHGHTRVHPVGAVTVGLEGKELAPLEQMAAAGVTVFSDDGKCVDDAALMRRALRVAAETGTVIAQHAQHGALGGDGQINAGPAANATGLAPWPTEAEAAVIARDVILAAETGGSLHVCHLSTKRAVEVVRWAKAQGWPVTAEVTPHHLLLTDELAMAADPKFKVNPPLRSRDDVIALREALLDGTIDVVATDHAPHPQGRKTGPWCGAAFGMTGLETALPVVAGVLAETGGVDWQLLSQVMSERPARIGRIAETAGRPLTTGEPATFVLVDCDAAWTVTDSDRYTKSGNTPFLGSTFSHRIAATVLDGRLVHGNLPLLGKATHTA